MKNDSKEYHEKNKEKIKNQQIEYKNNNIDFLKNMWLKYYENNKEKILTVLKEKYKENKENIILKSKEYYENHKDIRRKQIKEWEEKNKDILKEKRRIKSSKDRKLKPHVYAWRNILRYSLRKIGKKKEGHTIDLLGYSAIDLKEHLEKQFISGMTWNNYGQWEIDHIKEICTFDKETHQNIVNSLSNLQPLWKKDNLNKWFELKKKLKEKNISYVTQKTFKDCKNRGFLKFDFYLPELNKCIEFDGIQHFKSFNFFGGEDKLKETQKRDDIKNQFCINNNINLIRIPYNEFKNINKTLKML